ISSGSMSSVHTSGPSRRRRRTRPMRGTIGSVMLAAAFATLGMNTIDIENLHSRCLQALDEYRHEPFHHLITEIVVGLALLAQAGGVHRDGAGRLKRLRVVAPAIRRDQPGDADDLALAEGQEGHRAAPWRRELKC